MKTQRFTGGNSAGQMFGLALSRRVRQTWVMGQPQQIVWLKCGSVKIDAEKALGGAGERKV
ncbi:hypothetical protein BSPA111_22540 [Buttiauxella sp. A111]|nr:hypothetical protein BSPA111_22540 [Buttiauxella sp. A111]